MRFLLAVVGMVAFELSQGEVSAAAETCTWKQPDPTDYVGSSLTQTPEKALEGIKLVRSGKVYGLSHVYDEANIPRPFDRLFDITIFPFDVSEAESSQVFNEGVVKGHIGQVGTQFDGLGHAGHDLGFYNCASRADVGPDAAGKLQRLDVASVKPFFTRAVFLDFVHYSGAPKVTYNGSSIVKDSYVISVKDIEDVLDAENTAPPGRGDVVILYTGWDRLFGSDNDRFFFSPGLGMEAARWLAQKKIALVGADTMAVESLVKGDSTELKANPDLLGKELGPMGAGVHFILLTQNGIHLLEHMKLTQLADDLASDAKGENNYEFLFTFAPVPIKVMDGSPGQPLAIR